MVLFCFFIGSNLFRLGLAGADDANDILAFRITNDQDAPFSGKADGQEALLLDRVLVVIYNDRERIGEHGRSFEERDAVVVDNVGFGLVFVPFEARSSVLDSHTG